MSTLTTDVHVTLNFVRETKGAVLYKEVDKDGNDVPYVYTRIGNLYMRKRAFPNKIPTTIKVTVSYPSE